MDGLLRDLQGFAARPVLEMRFGDARKRKDPKMTGLPCVGTGDCGAHHLNTRTRLTLARQKRTAVEQHPVFEEMQIIPCTMRNRLINAEGHVYNSAAVRCQAQLTAKRNSSTECVRTIPRT